MCERARRSRDSVSRYTIDTLFPTLTSSKVSRLETSGTDREDYHDHDEKNIEFNGSILPSPTSASSTGSTFSPPTKSTKMRRGGGNGCNRGGNGRSSTISTTRDTVNFGSSGRDGCDNGTHLSPTLCPMSSSPTGRVVKTKTPRGGGGARSVKTKSTTKTTHVNPKTSPSKRRLTSPTKSSPKSTSTPRQHHHCLLSTPLAGGGIRISRSKMYEVFQPWVLQTYGDSAKTKTITKKKYARIVKTLRGEEVNNAENSKFRFWVKAKGFHIGKTQNHISSNNPPGHGIGPSSLLLDELRPPSSTISSEIPPPDLYIPTTVKDECGDDKPTHKRVAVVEQFFDIIYTVHVETEAKNGKHAGQKRTYRAITEKYAFLPREAVTKFLLQCTECQKRGSPTILVGDHSQNNVKVTSVLSEEDDYSVFVKTEPQQVGRDSSQYEVLNHSYQNDPIDHVQNGKSHLTTSASSSFDINFSLPFTTTYLRKQRKELKSKGVQGRNGFIHDNFLDDEEEENERDLESRVSDPSSLDDDHEHVQLPPAKKKSKSSLAAEARNNSNSGGSASSNLTLIVDSTPDLIAAAAAAAAAAANNGVDWLGYHPIALKKERLTPTSTTISNSSLSSGIYTNGKISGPTDYKEESSPLSLGDRSLVNHETGQDETSSNGNKDDEDDDDDESEDKMDTHVRDPERLKAFNMFVRLFVDENLDRMVPISKQPKEKIQAIIDSCTRQFPEFAERARKRIRTYLKSCRRNKRARDSNGWESTRPTPAHLTSVQAEQILAQACENESQNAKRMRMGLEPVGQPLPASATQNGTRSSSETISSIGKEGEKDHGTNTTTTSSSTTSHCPDKSIKSTTGKFTAANGITGSVHGGSTGHEPSLSNSTGSSGAMLSSATTGSGTLAPEGNLGIIGTSGSTGTRTPLSSSGSENQISTGSAHTKSNTAERNHLLDYSSRALSGNSLTNMSMYRPNFCQPFTRPFTGVFPQVSSTGNGSNVGGLGMGGFGGGNGLENCLPNGGTINNRTYSSSQNNNVSSLPILTNGTDIGPTDLSMKSKPVMSHHKLNTSEMSTVRQLITGYRESAAFLLRSADELEQLIIQQQQG